MRLRLLAPVTLLALTLSGCAAADAADIAPTEAAPSTEPAVAEPENEAPPLTAPGAFGDDCGAVVTLDELATSVGAADLPALDAPTTAMAAVAVRTLGGIACTWRWPDAAGRVSLTLLPVQAAIDEAPGESCYESSDGTQTLTTCRFASAVGEWWFTGSVELPASSATDPSIAVMSLTSAFGVRAGSTPAEVPVPPDGTWGLVPECASLASSVDAAAAFGVDLAATPGNLAGEADPGLYTAIFASGWRGCHWNGDTVFVESVMLRGAGWAATDAAGIESAEPIDVAGAASALAMPDGGRVEVRATDGANLVTTFASDAEDAAALASLLLGTMAG
ncbi:hypothetical protein ARHIZOSPH14_01740 [Agromyces rhizosphaerae]|uniref:DUF3558 domain-containing protein n=1 Tax=Agromyces rhizosphaerae TaxID=88374 RepID=A0A9W6CTA9_9MICO|nr:hypothetical protein [Agromyces rhizosphaerae]GLI25932.1 hypothetical protein ARHIZOSPH14_01740 [Agromyces rhizosphaerae]